MWIALQIAVEQEKEAAALVRALAGRYREGRKVRRAHHKAISRYLRRRRRVEKLIKAQSGRRFYPRKTVYFA